MSSDWLDDFLAGAHKAVGSIDWGTIQPFSNFQFHPLFANEWTAWLLELREQVLSKELTFHDLGAGGSPATDAFDQLIFSLFDMKAVHIPKEQRIQVAEFLHELGIYWFKKDSYSLKGQHIVHSPEEINAILRKLRFQKSTPESAKILGKIYSAAYHLTNGLYSDIYMGHSHANHGPYDTSSVFGPGTFLVIKEFINLKPVELWPDAKEIVHDTIRIYAIYDKGVHFETSMISCHSVYNGSPITGLVAWAVEADGNPITDVLILEKIRFNVEDNAVEKWKLLLSLDFETLKQQGVRMRCYTLSGVCKLLGVDWEPPQEMLDAVKGKPFVKEDFWKTPSTEPEKQEHWKKLLDPREDYFP